MRRKRLPHSFYFVLSSMLACAGILQAQTTAPPNAAPPNAAPMPSISSTSTETSSQADTYSPEQLKAMRAGLVAKAAATGAASKTLAQYPGHFTMLAYRSRTGGAELHAKLADVIVIIEGSATLESGGTIIAPTSSKRGETQGEALEHFSERHLHAGDIVHIPAGTPHLLRLEKDATLLYFVVKVQEVP